MKNATRIPIMVMISTVKETRSHLKSFSRNNAIDDAKMLKKGVRTSIETPMFNIVEPTESLNEETTRPSNMTMMDTYTPYLRTRPVALSRSIQSTPMSLRNTDAADATSTMEKYFLMELVSKREDTRVPINIPRNEPIAMSTA